MNREAREKLERITSKSPAEITKDDIAFLKARKSYLTREQIEELSYVFEEKIEESKKTKKRNNY